MDKIVIYKNGTILYQNKLQRLDIATRQNKIVEISNNLDLDSPHNSVEVVDCCGKLIFPALFDIHTHGAVGYDFNTANGQQMCKILDFFRTQGVAYVLPTVMTDSPSVLLKQLSIVAQLSQTRQEICGIHLEGTFLSAEYCGAMPKQFLQNPDPHIFEQYQKAAQGKIKLVTLSPELPNAVEFTRHLVKSGVAVSLGHSGADYQTTMRCVDAGAVGFTHTFNAMKPSTKHEPNILGAALLSDCYCEIIADGKHVNANMVRLLAKTKGIDKVVAVTDSMMAAAQPDGQYKLGANAVTVLDGDAKITGTDTRAGSTLTASKAVENFAEFCGLEFAQAIKTMTINPATMLGLSDTLGTIEIGKQAEFLVKDIKN